MEIDVSRIEKPYSLLRSVRKTSVGYLELRDSLEQQGQLQPIQVRVSPRDSDKFEVIDGNHRFHAALDLGWKSVDCAVRNINSESEYLALQLQSNAVRLDTNRVDYARQLNRLKELNPELTLQDFARLTGKSAPWVKRTLNLLRLRSEYQKYVERGEMTLMSANALAKLPASLQDEFIDQALTLDRSDFVPLADQALREVMESVKKGKLWDKFVKDYVPQPNLRPLKRVEEEWKSLKQASISIVRDKLTTPLDGWKAALEWALSMDEPTVEAARERAAQRLKKERKKKN